MSIRNIGKEFVGMSQNCAGLGDVFIESTRTQRMSPTASVSIITMNVPTRVTEENLVLTREPAGSISSIAQLTETTCKVEIEHEVGTLKSFYLEYRENAR